MEITNEQIKRIKDYSFIDSFDPDKHKLEDYKLILLLGNCIINGENQDGKCLFIPFDNWNEELQEGDCQDGNTYGYYHVDYMARALTSTQYQFPSSFSKVLEDLNIDSRYSSFFYRDLVFQGVWILGNYTYNNTKRDKSLILTFFIPASFTNKQIETSIKISKEINSSDKNEVEYNQYYAKIPERIEDELIESQEDLNYIQKRMLAGEIIDFSMETKEGIKRCSYTLRKIVPECITEEDLLKQWYSRKER